LFLAGPNDTIHVGASRAPFRELSPVWKDCPGGLVGVPSKNNVRFPT